MSTGSLLNSIAPSRAVDQTDVFVTGEADRWFQRNASELHADARLDGPLRLLTLYDLRPARVVEIGAANGYRLDWIRARCGADCLAVEPSAAAIADGRQRFPGLRFLRATADELALGDTFDLAIVNFVLHWVDRGRLLPTVAAIDRLVARGGWLIIGDFCPAAPRRVVYHHLPGAGVYTYKQDYSEIFLATGLYERLACLTGHHATRRCDPRVSDDDRIATWLLRKVVAEPDA